VEYAVVDGELTTRPVSMTEIPAWLPTGSGSHSVASQTAFVQDVLAEGGQLLGAFEDDGLLGLAVVVPSFEPGLAWLAWLHVSRPHRRQGVGVALWDAAIDLARGRGASSLYVSATPTGSAVGFYLRRGCRLADPVHPTLFAHEPDDVHLVLPLQVVQPNV
jgi:GNAT superfamily N-acetyltransferase